jgi:hypothetical protein
MRPKNIKTTKEETYMLKTICTNCDCIQSVRIPKGVHIEQYLQTGWSKCGVPQPAYLCSQCGCKTLTK